MGTIPFSNSGGNNQMSPGAPPINQGGSGKATGVVIGAGQIPGGPVSNPGSNPFIPGGVTPPVNTNNPIANPLTSGTTTTSGVGNPIVNPVNTASNPNFGSTSTNATQSSQQLTDIYGQGVGGDLNNLLNSIGGTNSATLQEFIQSLVPQEATAQANVNASLGAGGVSSNSSVAAIADSNLQAQEFSTISGEAANLTQSGQNLEASILTGMEPTAAAQVAESGWNVFGDVLSGLGTDASTIAASALKSPAMIAL